VNALDDKGSDATYQHSSSPRSS